MMDLFDLNQISELLKVEPGHGLVQSLLLALIWWESRGVKKTVVALMTRLADLKENHETILDKHESRLTDHEGRISKLEIKGG